MPAIIEGTGKIEVGKLITDGIKTIGEGASIITPEMEIVGENPHIDVDALSPDTEITISNVQGEVEFHKTGTISIKGECSGNVVFIEGAKAVLIGDLYCSYVFSDADSGIIDYNGFNVYFTGGGVFWVYATHTKVGEVIEITGGIE